jgi:hypothetical protein
MSDDYRNTGPTVPGASPASYDGRPSTDPASQSQYRRIPEPVNSGSGFGTGLLVAAVFVVIAVLAYAFYAPRNADVPATGATPAATEDGGTAPAADTTTGTAPAADTTTGTAPAADPDTAVSPDATTAPEGGTTAAPEADPAATPEADPATPPAAD